MRTQVGSAGSSLGLARTLASPLALTVVVGLVAAPLSCRGRDDDTRVVEVPHDRPQAPALLAADGAAAPHDHLAPGELIEGKEAVFGIALPLNFHVTAGFTDQAIAIGPSKAADVANYLRARVPAHSTTVGAASTLFEHVQSAAVPGRDLAIRVEPLPDGSGTRILVRDVTPPPTAPDIPEDERWREAGLDPQGRILDPTHLN
jgi:hypothetical protein